MDKLLFKTVQKVICSEKFFKHQEGDHKFSFFLSPLLLFPSNFFIHVFICMHIHTHTHTLRLQKALREFNKQVDGLSSSGHLGGAWDSTQLNQIDRSLGEMRRTLSGSGSGASDQLCFSQLGGLASVLRLLLLCSEPAPNCGSGGQQQQARARPLLPDKYVRIKLLLLFYSDKVIICTAKVQCQEYV